MGATQYFLILMTAMICAFIIKAAAWDKTGMYMAWTGAIIFLIGLLISIYG